MTWSSCTEEPATSRGLAGWSGGVRAASATAVRRGRSVRDRPVISRLTLRRPTLANTTLYPTPRPATGTTRPPSSDGLRITMRRRLSVPRASARSDPLGAPSRSSQAPAVMYRRLPPRFGHVLRRSQLLVGRQVGRDRLQLLQHRPQILHHLRRDHVRIVQARPIILALVAQPEDVQVHLVALHQPVVDV